MLKVTTFAAVAALVAGAASAQDAGTAAAPAPDAATAPAPTPDATTAPATGTTQDTTAAPMAAPATDTASAATPAPAAVQDGNAPSWTGLYAGIHGGYGFDAGQKVSVSGNDPTTANAIAVGRRAPSLNQNRAGWLGGGQVGYNLQRGSLLVGAEGDFSYMHARGNTDSYGNDLRRTHLNSDLDWMGTARARAGYVLGNGSGLFYGTGGYAFGRVKGSAEFDAVNNTAVNYYGGHKYIAQGWTAGVGAEFRPFAGQGGSLSRVSFRLESNYYDLGRSHIQATQTAAVPGSYTLGLDTKGYNARFGINYAF